jgi:hypothetical protein
MDEQKHLRDCKKRLKEMSKYIKSKDDARLKLLGNTWYKGRTGFEQTDSTDNSGQSD